MCYTCEQRPLLKQATRKVQIMREVRVEEASTHLVELIADAANGETVYIADNGYKVLLVPVPISVPRPTSVFDIGKNPIEDDLTDAARNHDRYIYGRD